MPDEEAALVAHLCAREPVVATPIRRVDAPELLVWLPVDVALREPDASFLVTPARFAYEAKVARVDGAFLASVVATPAVLYTRGHFDGARMSSTSLSAEWAGMPADFVRWGKRLMQWVRRTVPDWHRYKAHRITPAAEAARQAGLELVF